MGHPWFGVKDDGFGVSPKSAAGWISLAVYVLAMAATAFVVHRYTASHWTTWVALGLVSVVFVALVLIKSDRRPWRWRWGGR